jgi:hypothetical protein
MKTILLILMPLLTYSAFGAACPTPTKRPNPYAQEGSANSKAARTSAGLSAEELSALTAESERMHSSPDRVVKSLQRKGILFSGRSNAFPVLYLLLRPGFGAEHTLEALTHIKDSEDLSFKKDAFKAFYSENIFVDSNATEGGACARPAAPHELTRTAHKGKHTGALHSKTKQTSAMLSISTLSGAAQYTIKDYAHYEEEALKALGYQGGVVGFLDSETRRPIIVGWDNGEQTHYIEIYVSGDGTYHGRPKALLEHQQREAAETSM